MVCQLTNIRYREKRRNQSCDARERAIKNHINGLKGLNGKKKTGRQSQKRAGGNAKPADRELIRVIDSFISGNLTKVGALDGPFCYHGCASELSIRCGLPLLSLAVTPRSYVLRS